MNIQDKIYKKQIFDLLNNRFNLPKGRGRIISYDLFEDFITFEYEHPRMNIELEWENKFDTPLNEWFNLKEIEELKEYKKYEHSNFCK